MNGQSDLRACDPCLHLLVHQFCETVIDLMQIRFMFLDQRKGFERQNCRLHLGVEHRCIGLVFQCFQSLQGFKGLGIFFLPLVIGGCVLFLEISVINFDEVNISDGPTGGLNSRPYKVCLWCNQSLNYKPNAS